MNLAANIRTGCIGQTDSSVRDVRSLMAGPTWQASTKLEARETVAAQSPILLDHDNP